MLGLSTSGSYEILSFFYFFIGLFKSISFIMGEVLDFFKLQLY